VCRRWRSVVFAYPQHLDLRIVLTYNKAIRNAPEFWPVLPVILWYPRPKRVSHPILTPSDEDNISDILKNPARICEIDLYVSSSFLAKFASSLDESESFPALDHLRLQSQDSIFLNDFSAPRLCVLHLKGVAVPRLPRLLSSSKNLISLRLEDIRHDGYFMAEDLVIGLSAVAQLKSLVLGFHPLTSIPATPMCSSPLSSRIALPSLTEFRFEGELRYLKDFVFRTNTPIIEQISVSFFSVSVYDKKELYVLFGLGDELRSSRCLSIHIRLSKDHMAFSHHFSRIPSSPELFRLQLPFRTRRSALPLVSQVCFRLRSQDCLPKVTHLEIEDCPEPLHQDPVCWLNLFRPLTGLKTLHLVGKLGSEIALALTQVTGETVREILPGLQELHFGPETPSSTQAFIGQFVTQRQHHGLPVSVHFK